MVRARVPATTANLGPGFDCLGMAVDIYNIIEMEQRPGAALNIEITGSAATPDIARDESNLVYRAAARVFELAGRSPAGLQLKLELDAPLARGLGSSASAIVGGMAAANDLLDQPLDGERLLAEMTAMEGHPDNVTPCLMGGLTASLFLDGNVICDKAEPAPNIRCVFFIPDYELETSKARAVMPSEVSMKDAVFNASRVPFVMSRLQYGDLSDLNHIMADRLHQPYRIPLIKGYEDARAAAMGAGAAAVCISGAGPTILAICDYEAAAAVSEAGRAALEPHGVGVDCRIAKPDLMGCVIEG